MVVPFFIDWWVVRFHFIFSTIFAIKTYSVCNCNLFDRTLKEFYCILCIIFYYFETTTIIFTLTSFCHYVKSLLIFFPNKFFVSISAVISHVTLVYKKENKHTIIIKSCKSVLIKFILFRFIQTQWNRFC